MVSIIPEEVNRSPRLRAAVDRVTKLLETEVRDFATGDPVSTEWSVFHDERGRAGLDVAIADSLGAASRRILPEKLFDDDFLGRQVGGLWGDLLRIRSHYHRDRLRQMIATLDD